MDVTKMGEIYPEGPPPAKDNWRQVGIIISIGVVAALVVILAWRLSDNKTVAAEAVATISADTAFVDDVRQRTGLSTDPADMLKTGQEVCAAIGRGYSPIEVAKVGFEEFGPANSGTIVGSAINYLCPQYRDRIE